MAEPAPLALDDLAERLPCLAAVFAGLVGLEDNGRFSALTIRVTRAEARLSGRILRPSGSVS